MAGINFLSENYLDSAVLTLTTGTENAQFPLSNVKNVSTARKFRSVGNTVVIEIDLQQTRTIDTVAISGDATNQFGLTSASIKTSVTNDFSMSTPTSIDLSATENIGYAFVTQVSHRYVELTLNGTGSFAELGALFVGQRINLTQNSLSTGSFKYKKGDKSKVSTNRYSQRFIDQLPLVKSISGTIEYATKDEQEILDDMFAYHGINRPLWMIVDSESSAMNDGKYKLSIYGYLTGSPTWSAVGGQLYNADITMEQVV